MVERESAGVSSSKDKGSTLMASSELNYLSKALPPNTITYRVRPSTDESGGKHMQLLQGLNVFVKENGIKVAMAGVMNLSTCIEIRPSKLVKYGISFDSASY